MPTSSPSFKARRPSQHQHSCHHPVQFQHNLIHRVDCGYWYANIWIRIPNMWILNPSFDLIMDIGIKTLFIMVTTTVHHMLMLLSHISAQLLSSMHPKILTFNNYLNFNHRSALQLNYLY